MKRENKEETIIIHPESKFRTTNKTGQAEMEAGMHQERMYKGIEYKGKPKTS